MSDTFLSSRPIYKEDAVIKNIQISAAYIYALENLFLYFILNLHEDVKQIPSFFNRFEEYNKAKLEGKEPKSDFTEIEGHMFTVYMILQTLKANAQQQDLQTIGKVEIPKDTMNGYLEALQDGKKEDAFKLIGKLQDIFNQGVK